MRSQLGEALLRHDLGDRITVSSAGTHPSFVHPLTIAALEAINIDTSKLRSKSINEFLEQSIDLAITVCDSAHERCPIFPHAKKIMHKGYPDPVSGVPGSQAQEIMNQLRDTIRVELRELVISELQLRRN